MIRVDPEFRSYMRTLSDSERGQLRSNLVEHGGAHDPLILWGDVLLDGHNRYELCEELGLHYGTEQAAGVSSRDEALAWIVRHQLGRRNLTPMEASCLRGEWYRLEKGSACRPRKLPHSEGVSRGETAERLAAECGVSRSTIERDADLAQAVASLVDDVGSPGARQTILCGGARLTKKDIIQLAALDVGPDEKRKAIEGRTSLDRLKRDAQKESRAEEEAQAVVEVHSDPEGVRLIHSDCANLVQHLEPGSVDVILTDPPYPREFLHVYTELAALGEHALRDGGSLFAMVGQAYLPEVMSRLSELLTYRWTLAYLTPGGQATQVWPVKVQNFWKPVLWFTRSEVDEGQAWLGDVAKSKVNDNDKRFHHWGQSESGMADLVRRCTRPGDVVLDPFLGGGTTGAVCYSLGRRFIGADIDEEAVRKSRGRLSRG